MLNAQGKALFLDQMAPLGLPKLSRDVSRRKVYREAYSAHLPLLQRRSWPPPHPPPGPFDHFAETPGFEMSKSRVYLQYPRETAAKFLCW